MLKDRTDQIPSITFLKDSKVHIFNSTIAYGDGVHAIAFAGKENVLENCDIHHNSYSNVG